MRDPKEYQMVVNGVTKKVADATREELEADLMRAYDVIAAVEDHFFSRVTPITDLVGAFIEGKTETIDRLTKDSA